MYRPAPARRGSASFGACLVEHYSGVDLGVGQVEVVPDLGPRRPSLDKIGDMARRDPCAPDHRLTAQDILAALDVIAFAPLERLVSAEEILSDSLNKEHEIMHLGLMSASAGRIDNRPAHVLAQRWIELRADSLDGDQVEKISPAHLALGPATNADDLRVDLSIDVLDRQTGHEGRLRNRQARFSQLHQDVASKMIHRCGII